MWAISTRTALPSDAEESVATERAGLPAGDDQGGEDRDAGDAREPRAATGCDGGGRSPAAPSRRRSSASRARISSGRAAQTIVSDPSSATFAQYSVCIGAISSAPSRPIATE